MELHFLPATCFTTMLGCSLLELLWQARVETSCECLHIAAARQTWQRQLTTTPAFTVHDALWCHAKSTQSVCDARVCKPRAEWTAREMLSRKWPATKVSDTWDFQTVDRHIWSARRKGTCQNCLQAGLLIGCGMFVSHCGTVSAACTQLLFHNIPALGAWV